MNHKEQYTTRQRDENIRRLSNAAEEPPVRSLASLRTWVGGALLALCTAIAYVISAGTGKVPVTAAQGPASPAASAHDAANGAGALAVSPVRFEAQGFVTATRRATVSTLVPGIVSRVPVAVGDRVTKGQVIGVLDDQYARHAVALAERQHDAAEAAFDSAKVKLNLSEAEYEQEKMLQEKQFSSSARLAQKKAALDMASAGLASARAERSVVDLQARQQRIQLSYYTIRAPFSGIVTELNAQPGELIAPSGASGSFTRTGVATILDTTSLEVIVDVSESLIRNVHVGAPVTMSLYAYEGDPILGKVSRLMPSADRAKGTLQVRVTIDEQHARILPDMRVRVYFL